MYILNDSVNMEYRKYSYTPALGKQRQGDLAFKVILNHRMSSRPGWSV